MIIMKQFNLKSDGIYEKGFDKEKFTFYNNDQKIEII